MGGPVGAERGNRRPLGWRLAPAAAVITLALLLLAASTPVAAVVAAGAIILGVQWSLLDPEGRRRGTRRARAALRSAAAAGSGAAAGIAAAATWGLSALVFTAAVLPGWAVTRVQTRPLAPRSGAAGWMPLAGATASSVRHQSARRPSSAHEAPAAPRVRRRPARLALTATGVVGALVALDVAIGAVLAGTGLLQPPDRGDALVLQQQAAAQTMAMPNIAEEPWAAAFGEELAAYQASAPVYVPYLVNAPHPFRGRLLNVADGERASYRAPLPGGSTPLHVAFFGGSTTFGIGQRDDHTIPSEFARLAEAAGVPVVVHNYGFPAWVSWQEHEYLERLLAAGRRFDLVVFYDGYNEFLVQRHFYSRDPTHYGASTLQVLASGWYEEHGVEPAFLDQPQELLDAYARSSALWRVLGRVTGREPTPDWQAVPSASELEQRDAALGIYRRSTARIRDTAARAGVPVRSFWQPIEAGWPPEVTQQLPPGVVDLSHVLDGREQDLYISEVHTNEEGARLVAGGLWQELSPLVGQLATRRADAG